MVTLVEPARPENASAELALIQAAAQRAELLCRKPQEFTAKERQIVRRGDRALQQLLEVHQGLILRLVATYQAKGRNSRNTDLEQEAVLAFFDAVATYDPTKGSRLSTWAYFQVRARLQKVTGLLIKEAIATAKAMHSESTVTDPEPIQEQGFLQQLHSIIHKLTERQQKVVLLHLKGLGWAEIALKLKSTADAVRMLWTRAVGRLRQMLLGEEQREERKSQVVDSQPLEETRNVGKPLLCWLFIQQLSLSLVHVRSLGRFVEVNPQHRPFFNRQCIVSCRFWSDPSCSKGARGSPLRSSLIKRLTVADNS
jgi:RNA polymerase sigma factor (sigma-70 family)